jgi:hypothetical protein
MRWSEIDNTFDEFCESLEKAGARIQVALRHGQEVYHKNHKRWYTQRVKIAQSRFRLLRRWLSNSVVISGLLDDIEDPLKTLTRVQSDIGTLASVYPVAARLCETLRRAIQKREESEFDILTRESVEVDRKLCFVMMPFNPRKEFDPVYRAIRKAVTRAGLKCVRSDKVFDTRAIVWDIWDHIRKSRICVADISNRNPNVFYELGLGHALPKRVILISRELNRDEKPVFDVNYARTIFYHRSSTGLLRLQLDVYKTLKTALN